MEEYNLNELATLYDSLHKTPKAYSEDGFPMIRVTDVKRGHVSLSETKKVPEEVFLEFSKKHKPITGDIIFTRVGSYGNSCYVDKDRDFCLGQNTVCITSNTEKLVPYYLYCFLNSPSAKAQIDSFISGSSQPTISLKSIKEIKVPVPTKNQQEAISKAILNYDNLIENNNRRIAILEDMAQSLYREWFVNFRYPNHEDNLDADGNPKLIDSPLGQIPEGWEVVVLENLCNKITDGAHKSPKSVDVGVPMASVKDMHDFGINASKCRQISYEDYEDLKRQDSVVKANDILVAKDGSYLKHTFVVEKELEMALLSSIAIIRPNEKVKPHWLAYCLRSPLVKERMKNYVSGAAIPRIILKDFRKFNLFIPPQELMDEWNSIVEEMVKQCWNLVSRNENLKQQRDMMLPKLISGQIELKD